MHRNNNSVTFLPFRKLIFDDGDLVAIREFDNVTGSLAGIFELRKQNDAKRLQMTASKKRVRDKLGKINRFDQGSRRRQGRGCQGVKRISILADELSRLQQLHNLCNALARIVLLGVER